MTAPAVISGAFFAQRCTQSMALASVGGDLSACSARIRRTEAVSTARQRSRMHASRKHSCELELRAWCSVHSLAPRPAACRRGRAAHPRAHVGGAEAVEVRGRPGGAVRRKGHGPRPLRRGAGRVAALQAPRRPRRAQVCAAAGVAVLLRQAVRGPHSAQHARPRRHAVCSRLPLARRTDAAGSRQHALR